jgi:death-on-curing protein
MLFLSAEDIVLIHENVIDSNELQGMATHKSIEAVIARIHNRMAYGMISDVYELAACYASYIAVGHVFHDANKRTAFASMDICLTLNGIEIDFNTEEAGDRIIKSAQQFIDESDLAMWLRELSRYRE